MKERMTKEEIRVLKRNGNIGVVIVWICGILFGWFLKSMR